MSNRQSRKIPSQKRMRLSVVLRRQGWTIAGGANSEDPRHAYKTQREALAAARKLIRTEDGGEIIVHGRDGRIRGVDTYTLGGDSFDKISAVEGIYLTEELRRDFQALDRKRLSPEKRRAWLIAKYGPRSDDIRRRK